MRNYRKRVYDQILEKRLAAKGAVLIEGLKWCGKTTTAQQHAKSILYLQDPRARAQNLRLAQLDPSRLLEGSAPRLIDEWQDAPQLWDAVRFEVDERGEFGQFILTGSSVPADMSEMAHSGTGRIARMRMGTMSLFESGESTGDVSLGQLFSGRDMPIASCEDDLGAMAFLTCRGGWPESIDRPYDVALQQAFDYLDALAETDVSRVDGVKRNPLTARALMRSYARMSASQGTSVSIFQDVTESGHDVSPSTLNQYLEALSRLFVTDDLPAWNPNLRSKTAIRTSATRHFADPSIAIAALGATPAELLDDLSTFGLMFETLCIRDLRAYAQALDGEVMHYRDRSGLEADAVVRLRNGKYGLVEIKLGGSALIEEGAKSLKALAQKIDIKKMRDPSFLMVLTATGGFSYTRDDGVLVVPVRTLGV